MSFFETTPPDRIVNQPLFVTIDNMLLVAIDNMLLVTIDATLLITMDNMPGDTLRTFGATLGAIILPAIVLPWFLIVIGVIARPRDR